MCVLSIKVPIRKKSGNLSYAPRNFHEPWFFQKHCSFFFKSSGFFFKSTFLFRDHFFFIYKITGFFFSKSTACFLFPNHWGFFLFLKVLLSYSQKYCFFFFNFQKTVLFYFFNFQSTVIFFNFQKYCFWFPKVKLATLVDGSFFNSYYNSYFCRERYSFPWIASLYPWSQPYNVELSKAASSTIF